MSKVSTHPHKQAKTNKGSTKGSQNNVQVWYKIKIKLQGFGPNTINLKKNIRLFLEYKPQKQK